MSTGRDKYRHFSECGHACVIGEQDFQKMMVAAEFAGKISPIAAAVSAAHYAGGHAMSPCAGQPRPAISTASLTISQPRISRQQRVAQFRFIILPRCTRRRIRRGARGMNNE